MGSGGGEILKARINFNGSFEAAVHFIREPEGLHDQSTAVYSQPIQPRIVVCLVQRLWVLSAILD